MPIGDIWRAPTNKVNDAIRNAQGACCLNTAAQLDDLGPQLPRGSPALLAYLLAILLGLQPREVLLCEVDEAGADVLADQVLPGLVGAVDRDLDLELAASEPEIQDGLASPGLSILRRHISRGVAGPHAAPVPGLVLLYLVETSDAQVDRPLAHEGRDVRRRQEDKGDVEVLDERDVESVFPSELDVGALEEVECGLLEPALW